MCNITQFELIINMLLLTNNFILKNGGEGRREGELAGALEMIMWVDYPIINKLGQALRPALYEN